MPKPFRRAVFFIAGFDPNGAQYLYWLFRREFGKDNALYRRRATVGRLVTDADKLPGWRNVHYCPNWQGSKRHKAEVHAKLAREHRVIASVGDTEA